MFDTSYYDIFDSSAQCLVNPVNCVGVAGAGLAKKFRHHFPENFEAYRERMSTGNLLLGSGVSL